MKRSILLKTLILISAVLLLFTSCGLTDYDLTEAFYRIMNVEDRSSELTFLEAENTINNISPDEEYDVLIITDVHIGNENKKKNGPRREAAWFDQITKTDSATGKRIVDSVKFVICMGDIAEHGYVEEFTKFNKEVTNKLSEIKTTTAPDGIKIYNVVGNHDLYNTGWHNWAATQYPGVSFYKFETPSFSWYFLDSASGTLGEKQFDAMKKDMKKDTKQKLCFSHVPLYADNFHYFIMQNTEERNKIISTVSKNNAQFFFDGHTHDELYTDFGKFQEVNVPGFLEKYGYGILHINEKDQTACYKVMYY